MKGLAIAEDFFLNWGLPFLEQAFPELINRVAAGRFSGSDVLGADDDLSRDHNWGPQFSLFLSASDYEQFGAQLSETMNSNAPEKWQGTWLDGAGDQSVLVENVPVWIEEATGFKSIPQADTDWGIIVKDRRHGGSSEGYESALYYLRYGALWLDNNAEFARWRVALATYPDSVWFARLAEECFKLWQYGQYNFIQRVAPRDDPATIAITLGRFSEGVMRMLLLLYRHYTPYWKWLAHEFRKLEQAKHYAPLLDVLLTTTDRSVQSELVDQICQDIYQELLSQGVITGKGTHELSEYLLPLINAQYELMAKAPWLPNIL